MLKYKIVKQSNALPEGWHEGEIVPFLRSHPATWCLKGVVGIISASHLQALLELGVVEEVKEEVKKKHAQIGGKLYEITSVHVIMPEYEVPQYQDIKKVELFVTGLE